MEILFIVSIIFLVVVIIHYFTQKKIPNNTVIGFTGALGSGKSYIGVHQALKHYSSIRKLIFFRLLKVKVKPVLLSNIPIYMGRQFIFFGKQIWSKTLTYAHLVGIDHIPEHSTIFVDEFGQFASQYDFDNPFVMQYLQKFLRLFRHWTDGKLIFTDQSSSNIVKALRTRMNQIYHLSDFSRFLFFFYKVNVQELQYLEDGVQTTTSQTEIQELPFFFGYLPFKYLKFLNPFKPRYDSRCYSITYQPLYHNSFKPWSAYKTDYFIDLPNNSQMRKQFKYNGFITLDDMLKYLHEWQTKDNKQVVEGVVGEGQTPLPPQSTDE
jgi:hypothetical protein